MIDGMLQAYRKTPAQDESLGRRAEQAVGARRTRTSRRGSAPHCGAPTGTKAPRRCAEALLRRHRSQANRQASAGRDRVNCGPQVLVAAITATAIRVDVKI